MAVITSNNLSPGMTISLGNKVYRVESNVKVTVPKGTPFIKTKLRDLATDEVIEKNFKLEQAISDVAMVERKLEFLYTEGKSFLFLDVGNLEQTLIPPTIIGQRANYLKEGVEIKAFLYGSSVFSVELPQFLELMVARVEGEQKVEGMKIAFLETGAKIDVPPFIEAGDVIKVGTRSDEYIQRV